MIGPDYRPAPELTVAEGVARGTVRQFTIDSKDTLFNPGIAREVFGTVDPNNPKTLIVETIRSLAARDHGLRPRAVQEGTEAPFMVVHDGPALGKAEESCRPSSTT